MSSSFNPKSPRLPRHFHAPRPVKRRKSLPKSDPLEIYRDMFASEEGPQLSALIDEYAALQKLTGLSLRPKTGTARPKRKVRST